MAQDMEWLLENGSRLDCSERTTALYDNWLRVLDYRTREGKTNLKSLAAAIVGYYGQEFLELMNAYTSGACSWLKYHFLDTQKLSNPIHHLLLMRFLCGSPENFFAGSGKNTPEYLPYGKPPYPCLNRICDHYLQDVIENVEIVIAHVPHGTFACPHCGFTYRRKGKLEKEKQYATTAQTVKYGWKWEELVTGMLLSGKPLSVITKQAHSGFYTVLSFGIQNGLIEAKEHITKSTTHSPTPQLSEPYKNDNSIERCERYRTRFVSLRAENPYALRNALVLLDAKCCKWLYENDRDWFEQHAPPKFSDKENWSERDAEYAERIEIAINQIRDAPGRPQRLSLKALAKASGISTLRLKLATGKYPRTESLIMANRETAEQWQKRKIIWAVREMSGKGISLTISKVLNLASVGYEQCTHLGGFVAECIEQNR
ncbi:hypothetical protein FACS1894219_02380 [Clostridia bacterium]|nr:hypothetical protein FACS1894219_02380 [Clostridia bacterium]